jgi:hypothetical protein
MGGPDTPNAGEMVFDCLMGDDQTIPLAVETNEIH